MTTRSGLKGDDSVDGGIVAGGLSSARHPSRSANSLCVGGSKHDRDCETVLNRASRCTFLD